MTRMGSPVSLMHHYPDRSWITDPDPDHPKGRHPYCFELYLDSGRVKEEDRRYKITGIII